jgi:hypothetical protein
MDRLHRPQANRSSSAAGWLEQVHPDDRGKVRAGMGARGRDGDIFD